MMTNQLTPVQSLCKTLSSDSMKGQIDRALPAGMDAERFLRTATNAIQLHPQKEKIAEADRQSVFNSCIKAAADGLEVDGREATLVVFNTKQGNQWVPMAQYIPMTQGLVKLARNSGEIASISAEVVYEVDQFTYYHDSEGTVFKHEPNMRGDRGNPEMVWACVKLKNGETIVRAFSKDRVMQVANTGKNAKQYSPTEGTHFEEWWRKMAIKNVLKYAPKSTALDSAMQADNDVMFDDLEVETSAPQETAPKETKAAQVVKEAAPNDMIEPEVVDVELVEVEPNIEDSPI